MSEEEIEHGAGRPVVVVMGVSGCGKTFLGEKLAKAIGAHFLEGDSFHPPENIALMSSGHPLDDAHRMARIRALHQEREVEPCRSSADADDAHVVRFRPPLSRAPLPAK